MKYRENQNHTLNQMLQVFCCAYFVPKLPLTPVTQQHKELILGLVQILQLYHVLVPFSDGHHVQKMILNELEYEQFRAQIMPLHKHLSILHAKQNLDEVVVNR